MIKPQITVC